MDAEHGLAHERGMVVTATNGQAEERVEPRCGGEDRLAEAPAAAIDARLARAADVAPEVIEVVAYAGSIVVFVLARIALEAASALVLHGEIPQRFVLRRQGSTGVVCGFHVGPEILEISALRCVVSATERESDDDLVFGGGVEGVLDGLAHERVGDAAEGLSGEELVLDRVDVQVARPHRGEAPGHWRFRPGCITVPTALRDCATREFDRHGP